MTDTYRPTPEDIQRIKPRPDMLKVSGDGVFATLQGEGATAGQPAVFLRLQYCNLACGASSGWKCDTEYTWNKKIREYWQEPEDWSYAQTAKQISNAWDSKFGNDTKGKRLVVTGGEPLLQQQKIARIKSLLPEWDLEIETNGTIAPIEELHDAQFNCSPKLANSGNSLQARYKPDVIRLIAALPNSWFKFVALSDEDLGEVEKIVSDCGINNLRILIMPEGQTAEEVKAHREALEPAVLQRGWIIIERNQLIWFGPKRRT